MLDQIKTLFDEDKYEKVISEANAILKTSSSENNYSEILDISTLKAKAHYQLEQKEDAFATFENAISLFDSINKNHDEDTVTAYTNLQCTLAIILFNHGKDSESIKASKLALEWSEKIGDDAGIGRASYNLGVITQKNGDFDASYNYLNRFMKIAQNKDDHLGVAYANMEMGGLEEKKGNLEGALIHFKNSFELYLKHGGLKQQAWSHTDLGNIYRKMGQLKLSLAHYQKALPAYEEEGDERTLANHVRSMAGVIHLLGDYKKSLSLNVRSLKLYNKIGNIPYSGKAYQNIGEDYYFLGNYKRALENYNKSEIILREYEDYVSLTHTLFQLVRFHIEQGNNELSMMFLQNLKEINQQINSDVSHQAYILSEAIFLKHSDMITREKSIKLLSQISKNNINDSTYYFAANKYFAKMLLARYLEDPSYDTHEAAEAIDKLVNFGEAENAFPILVEGLILKAKLSFLEMKHEEGTNIIERAFKIANENGLIKLLNEISSNYSSILEK